MAVATPRSGDLLAPGQRIGPFLLLAPLGSGGSGRAWAVARTGQLGFTKRMVLKVMRQDKLGSERARRRFDLEARLGAQLRHSHLRAVHEVGSHAGRPYMALSWVDASLAELLEHAPGRRVEPSVACWLAIQTCEALAAAHGHVNHTHQPCPIVHGDVSPGNILLTTQGHVLLADLAGTADPSAAQPPGRPAEEAAPQRFFGSLGYASPEALRGLALDGRSDMFSLGCVLYEMLCGAPAFEGDDERSIIYQVLEQEPPDVRQRAPEVPPELAAVLRKALERRVDERFQGAEEMRSALRQCVRRQGSFWLEERSSNLIQRVLGERIRAREEEMRLVFQRFSASRFERTDTLPIASGLTGRSTATLRARAPQPLSESTAGVARSGGAVAPVQPARWGFWAILLFSLTLAGGYLVKARGRAPVLAAAATGPAQPTNADLRAGAELTQQQALQRLPPDPASAARQGPRSESSSSGAQGGALPAVTSAPSPPAGVAAAPARKRPAAERRVSVAVPSAAARATPPEPSPVLRKPFQWNFPADPYDGEGPAAAPKPTADAQRGPPEPPAAP